MMAEKRRGVGSGRGAVMTQAVRYRAFLSYSHQDAPQVRSLWRSLESYRVPRRLVGQATPDSPVPRRLAPIFLDRGELPASDNLSVSVQTALAQSRYLIVACSPSAAASRWVNEEILTFKRLRGHDRHILPVILAGDPEPADPADQCFPTALRYRLDPATGTLSDQPIEPAAADLRPGRDGARLARLKLASGLAGVGLDRLIRREEQRRTRTVSLVTGSSAALVLAMATLTVIAVNARHEAEARRADAEGLIQFMLTDLRTRLDEVGRLDVLDAVADKAVSYYDAQDLARLDSNALGRRARAYHLLGEIDEKQGDLAGAEAMFAAAHETTGALLDRAPSDPDRLYEHAQSAYWRGFAAWRRGDTDTALDAIRHYRDTAVALSRLDPARPDWAVEIAYARSSLGTLLLRSNGDAAAALPEFEAALAIHRARWQAQPDDRERTLALADAHAWVADCLLRLEQVDAAIRHRQAEHRLLQKRLAAAPDDKQTAFEILGNRLATAHLFIRQNDHASAGAILAEATDRGERLVAFDPENDRWRAQLAILYVFRAEQALAIADLSQAEALLVRAGAVGDLLKDRQEMGTQRSLEVFAFADIVRARLMLAKGDPEAARFILGRVPKQEIEALPDGRTTNRAIRLEPRLRQILDEITSSIRRPKEGG